MSTPGHVIFAKNKLSQTNEELYVEVKHGTTRSLQADGDLGTDVITVKHAPITKGDTPTDAYDVFGAILTVSKLNPSVAVYSSAILYISKPVTDNDVGLRLV